jgi:hypothetical protein
MRERYLDTLLIEGDLNFFVDAVSQRKKVLTLRPDRKL